MQPIRIINVQTLVCQTEVGVGRGVAAVRDNVSNLSGEKVHGSSRVPTFSVERS